MDNGAGGVVEDSDGSLVAVIVSVLVVAEVLVLLVTGGGWRTIGCGHLNTCGCWYSSGIGFQYRKISTFWLYTECSSGQAEFGFVQYNT